MADYSSSNQRRILKYRLRATRVHVVLGYGIVPLCAVCRKPILYFHGVDMHEVVTRGHARGTKVNIFVNENSVLLHTGNCHTIAQTTEYGEFMCIDYLIECEGLEKIRAFYEKLQLETLTLGVTMFKQIDEVVKALQEIGINADGTLENAFELASKYNLIKSKGQPGADKGVWELKFHGRNSPVITVTPTLAVLSHLYATQTVKTKQEETVQPEEQEKSDGKRSGSRKESQEI